MKRTLLTGFGPFGSVVNNPSQRLAEHFAEYGASGHELTTHVFPVSYAGVAQQLNELAGDSGAADFDILLMMGVARTAKAWLVERQGANSDNPGCIDRDGLAANGGAIIPGMPDRLDCSLPLERIVGALQGAGIPAVLSDSAGGYLCNHLLFRALAGLQGVPGVIAGFIHIPPDPDTFDAAHGGDAINAPSFEMHVLAMETVLRELAAGP